MRTPTTLYSHVYENYDHAGNPAIHIFSCFFFEQYRKCAERREGKDVEDHLKIAHAQVSRWTKGTDLFSKDILLIPINDKYVSSMNNIYIYIYIYSQNIWIINWLIYP